MFRVWQRTLRLVFIEVFMSCSFSKVRNGSPESHSGCLNAFFQPIRANNSPVGVRLALSVMKGSFMHYVVLIEADIDAEYSIEKLAKTISDTEFGISGKVAERGDIQYTKAEIKSLMSVFLNKWHDDYFQDGFDGAVEPSPVSFDEVYTLQEYIEGLNANTILPPSKAHGRYVALVKTCD